MAKSTTTNKAGKWLELSLQAPAEYVEPLSVIFQRYSYGGVAVEQVGGPNPDQDQGEWEYPTAILRCYISVDRTTASRKEHIRVAVELIRLLCSLPPVEERLLEEGEWMESWKKHFTVLHVGRVVVCPTWKEYSPQPEEVVVMLDPGMAFGTGHHPTTRMCLSELEMLVMPGHRVLDVGTGSGILSIAAAKLGAQHVLAMDTDPLAVKAARANAKINHVQHQVKVQRGTLNTEPTSATGFDLVVANIYSKLILDLAPAMMALLAPQGSLVVSGITAEHTPDIETRLQSLGLELHHMSREGDWVALVGTKLRG